VLAHGARQRGRHDARQSFPHGNGKAHGSELGTATATTHGSELGHDSDMTHGSELGHGSDMTHGNGHDARQRMPARQRAWTHGNVLQARQSSLPSRFGETHGKVFVAEPGFAVSVLPCVDARQCLCRAILCLCRAICPHDKALFSGSECWTFTYQLTGRSMSATKGRN
jgi:hypothetical protein